MIYGRHQLTFDQDLMNDEYFLKFTLLATGDIQGIVLPLDLQNATF